jgi:hypothetical protein
MIVRATRPFRLRELPDVERLAGFIAVAPGGRFEHPLDHAPPIDRARR